MQDCGLSLGGYSSVSLANAYCDEALARPDRFLVLLASRDEQVLGYVVVLKEGWGFWRGFLVRHPLLAMRMGVFAFRAVPRQQQQALPWAWHSQASLCQRILMIAVAPAARRQGVAQDLYRHIFSLLADRSLLALVSADNEPSLALHRATGWVLSGDGASRLATLPNQLSGRDRL